MSSNTGFKFVPMVFLTLFMMGGAVFGMNAMTGQAQNMMGMVKGNEYGCTVSKMVKTEVSNEIHLHAEGCNGSEETKVFLADVVKLKGTFDENKFYSRVKNGETFNFGVQGMTVKKMDMVPEVVSVQSDMWPY